MSAKIGLGSVLSHLHRNLGLDRATHPELYHAADAMRERLAGHLAIEGLELLRNSQLGVMSIATIDEELLARHCEDEGVEPFRPIYVSRSEDYWTSALMVILRRRYDRAITNPEAAWMALEEIISEFETFIAPEERENSARTLDKVQTKLRHLCESRYVEMRDLSGPQFAATKWLVIRLTTDKIEDMMRQVRAFMAAHGDELDEDAREAAPPAGTPDLFDDLLRSAEAVPLSRPDDDLGGEGLGTAAG